MFGKKILYLVSDKSQVKQIKKHLQRQNQDEVFIVSTTVEVNSSTFEAEEVSFHHLAQFIKQDSKTIDDLGQETLYIKNHLFQVFDKALKYKGVSLLSCLVPELMWRYVQPSVQAVCGFQKMIETLTPDEIWVTSLARKGYFAPIFARSGPSLLAYHLLYPYILIEVAKKFKVKTCFYHAVAQEQLRYFLGKYLRIPLFQIYKLIKWVKKPSVNWFDPNVQPKSVGFFIRAQVHASRLLPIAEQLGEEKSLLLVDSVMSGDVPKIQNSLPIAGRFQYLTSIWSLVWGRLKKTKIKKILASKTWSYDGIDLSEIIAAAFASYIYEIDELVTYIKAVQKIATHHKLRVMVTAHDTPLVGQAVVRMCHELKIPTLLVQHGILANPPIIYLPISSKVAVFGENTKQMLEKWGVSASRIEVTGIPADQVFNDSQKSPSFEGKTNVDGLKKRTITFLPGTPTDASYFVSRAVELGKALNEQVVLKLHPLDPHELYASLLAKMDPEKCVKLAQRENLQSILQETDLLISNTWSTAIIEGIEKNIPVILLQELTPRIYDLVEHPLFTGLMIIQPEESVLDAAKSLLYDSARRAQYLAKQICYAEDIISNNGDAAAQIVEILHELSGQAWSPILDTPTFSPSRVLQSD